MKRLCASWLRRVSVGALLLSSPLAAQQRDAILLLQKSDTFSIERFARTSSDVQTEMVIKPAGMRINLTAMLGANGQVESASMAARQASADKNAPPLQSATVRFQDDSVFVDVATGAGKTTQRLGTTRGAIPFINPSFALMELAIAKARASGGDTVRVPLFMLQGARPCR